MTSADILIETLISWNVDAVFGLPGDGINGIMGALRVRQDRIRFIQVRHEESAAFMATAYAKWTGRPGVCLATSGPGGAHLLTGLYDDVLDRAPVLAITGMQAHDLADTFTQQDVDLTRVFNDMQEQALDDATPWSSSARPSPLSNIIRNPVRHGLVQIDRDAERIGLRYPVEVGLVGDAAETLRRMLAIAQSKTDMPLKPQVVAAAFGRRLPDTAILASDSGQNTELAARHVDLRPGQDYSVSGTLASMACGLPYAIAAGLAFPDRPVFAIVGDGGFAMQLGEFSTAVRYGVPLKLLVIKNGMLNQIVWEQMMFLGNPQFGCELQPIDFAKAAEAMGGTGFTIDRPEDVERVLDQAFATDGAVVIQAVVDAYEPMMPPKLPPQKARNFRQALPETPGHERIEAAIAAEPLHSMIEAGTGGDDKAG